MMSPAKPHALTLSACLLFCAAEVAAGPPRRTRAEKIADKVYADGVKQRKAAIDRRNNRRWSGSTGTGRTQRHQRGASIARRCAALRHLASRSRVDFRRLQDVILPSPPGVPLSRWNGVTIPGRVRYYGEHCPLRAAVVHRLIHRDSGKSSGTRRSRPRVQTAADRARRARGIREHNQKFRTWRKKLYAEALTRLRRRIDAPPAVQPSKPPFALRPTPAAPLSRLQRLKEPDRNLPRPLEAGWTVTREIKRYNENLVDVFYRVYDGARLVVTRKVSYRNNGAVFSICDKHLCTKRERVARKGCRSAEFIVSYRNGRAHGPWKCPVWFHNGARQLPP